MLSQPLSEMKCIKRLERLRWEEGPRCPSQCGGTAWQLNSRKGFYDCSCGKQFSVKSGTIFEHNRGSLEGIFAVLKNVIAQSGFESPLQCLSVNDVIKILGSTYKTSWITLQKIRHIFVLYNLARRKRFKRQSAGGTAFEFIDKIRKQTVHVKVVSFGSGVPPEIEVESLFNDDNAAAVSHRVSKLLRSSPQTPAREVFAQIKSAVNCRDSKHLCLVLAELEFRLNEKNPRERINSILDSLLKTAFEIAPLTMSKISQPELHK